MTHPIPRLLLVVLFIGTLISLPGNAHAQSPEADVRVTQVDTNNYPDVTIYVAATDEHGQPVSRFTRDDFHITEDGTDVEITKFGGSGQHQIHTALVIDRSGSMEDNDKLEGAQDAARTFVEHMAPGDQTTLIAFNSEPDMRYRLTDDTEALLDEIDDLEADGGTAIYDSMVVAVDALQNTSGRTVVLLLTDGQDCRDSEPCPDNAGSDISRNDAIAYANDHNQPVYVVGLGNRGRDDTSGIDENVLHHIASDTGGEYFYAPRADDLVALYERLSSDVHTEYAITYRSPRPFYDGTRRDIRVQVGQVVSSGAYTEQHLINVRSHLLVGALLLLPLIGLLVLPTVLQSLKQKSSHGESQRSPSYTVEVEEDDSPENTTPSARSGPAVSATQGGQATYSNGSTPPANDTHSEQETCAACGAALRPGARFCGTCGAKANPDTT